MRIILSEEGFTENKMVYVVTIIFLTLVIVVLSFPSFVSLLFPNKPPASPINLVTNGQINPTNLQTNTPKFSAIFNDLNQKDFSTTYQLQVSLSPSFDRVYWDSGLSTMSKVISSNRSQDITYTGPKLSNLTNYYWRIRFWDSKQKEGSWSIVPASFSISRYKIFSNAGGGMWKYRRPVQVTGLRESINNGYSLKVLIETESLVSAGKLQSNFGDLRFATLNDKELPWWFESNFGSSSQFWVKVDSLSKDGFKIYAYYGNPSSTIGGDFVNNGKNTFEFFDDFESQTLNTELWGAGQRYRLPTESNGILKFKAFYPQNNLSDGEEIQTRSTFNGSNVAEFKMTMNAAPLNNAWKSTMFSVRIGSSSSAYLSPWATKRSGWWSNVVQDCTAVNGESYLGKVIVDVTNGEYSFILGDTTCGTSKFTTTSTPYVYNFASEAGWGGNMVEFHDFRVRSYLNQEPIAIVGVEEN
jgi:hypothetical protein